MTIRWTASALRELRQIETYLDAHDALAASRIVDRIGRAAARLDRMPHLGRPVRGRDARQMVVARTRYVLVYRVIGHEVAILAVFHERQERPTSFLPG